MSGSTLLATAEAVLSAGVKPNRLTVYCGHAPDPQNLRAPRAMERWARLRVQCPSTSLRPQETDLLELSAGSWRAFVFTDPEQYPASWVQQERSKFLEPVSGRSYKFIGLPPYGRRLRQRAETLWQAGFGTEPLGYADGFLCSRWAHGKPLTAAIGLERYLERVAEYCAHRRRHFGAGQADADALTRMARVNVEESLGASLPANFRLSVQEPVWVDGRMLPHEWIVAETPAPRLLKVDALDHGTGHLFPGPTDIRWDLAGAIIEWGMHEHQQRHFVERYAARDRRAASSVAHELGDYSIAYAAFRVGCMTFAKSAAAMDERVRLERAQRRYLQQLAQLVRRRGCEVPDRHMRQFRDPGPALH
jgi:hypothetical protein